MKRRELIKLELNLPFTRLCKKEIKPSTKMFGDDLSRHLKDMAEVKMAGIQTQKDSCWLNFNVRIQDLKAEIQQAILTE